MKKIVLRPFHHRGQECMGIVFDHDKELNLLVKNFPGVKWSQTNRCWYLPLTRENYKQLNSALYQKAEVVTEALKQHLEKKTKVKVSVPSIRNTNTSGNPAPALWGLSKENHDALEKFIQQLKLKAYSPGTIRTYRNEFFQLLHLLKKKPVSALTTDELRRYFVYCCDKLRLSENTLHSRINAIKFYFEQVMNREKFFWEIPRPKKPLLLPKLLSEKELGKLFKALSNKKHKAMLFTAYSAGLRVSEIVNLKIKDIDSSRMQIFIRRAKGKKDRYVNLSPVLLDILRVYIKDYKPSPKVYLFESENTSSAYPIRTVQQIFSNAKARAGILKDVGIHSLRHSFATHLLDKGTDIRYIKELLGHFDIRTTERYLHVSKQQLVNVLSPLDDLVKKENLDW